MTIRAQKTNRFALWQNCAIVAAAALWQGCAPTKTVMITSTPDKAHLTIYKVTASGQESPYTVEGLAGDAPVTVPLAFADQAHYRVEAHHVLCMPSFDTVISLDATTSYNIQLTQYKQYVTGLVNMPVKNGDLWIMKPTAVQTVATIDPTEPSLVYVNQPVPITKNHSPDVDFPSFTTSPTAAVMVYEQITQDSSTNTGYASKLYKLPLAAGENPTLLTLGRKQQRFPAFDYSGDNVVFDSNDDNRTDAPFAFKSSDNEASIGHLEHDSDTLEYGFSISKDSLAFTSYGPNATEPEIQAAGRDGAGPTPRATGLAPQLSPDGNQILYIHRPEGGGKYRLSIVNTHGPIVTHELVQNDDVDYFDPHWSPDGSMIVFCSSSRGKDLPDDNKKELNSKYHDADAEHSFLWIMSSDGQHTIRLTRNESFDSDPVFDRNGRSIYFRSNRGGMWNIWKLDLSDEVFTELHVTPPVQ